MKQKLASSTGAVYIICKAMLHNIRKHMPDFMVEKRSNNQIYDISGDDNSES